MSSLRNAVPRPALKNRSQPSTGSIAQQHEQLEGVALKGSC